MSEYYKDRYQKFLSERENPYGNKSLAAMSKVEMDSNLKSFIESLFGEDIFANDALSKDQKQQLIRSMMIFVFSHRHNKGDRFITETLEELKGAEEVDRHFDFSMVRNVMYLYSKKAQEQYFKYPVESFFIAMFAKTQDGKTFIKEKPDTSENQAKQERILHDTGLLLEQALVSLGEGSESVKKMCNFFLEYVSQAC